MLPAIVIEQPPRLIRAIKLLPGEATPDEAAILADELSGITAITVLSEGFERRDTVCQLTRQVAFIRALPHFPVMHDVMAASHSAPPLTEEKSPAATNTTG